MTNSNKQILIVIIKIILKKTGANKTEKVIVDRMTIMIIDRIGDNILIDNSMKTIDSKITGIMDHNKMMIIIIMTIDFIIKDLHNNKIVLNFILKVIMQECKILIRIYLQINNNNNLRNHRFKIIILL